MTMIQNHDTNAPRLGVIFLGRRRPGFDMSWGAAMEERVRGWLRGERGFSFTEPQVKVIDEPSLRRALAEFEQSRIDALVVLQTTMGDGRLAPSIAQFWPSPVILWATPENQQGDMISSCSLVGAHCWGSVLRQLGHAFELVYGEPEAAHVQQQFREAVGIVVTARRLRTVRIGAIGGHAPGFFGVAPDAFVMHQRLGVQVQTYSLVEFQAAVEGITAEAVAADVGKVKSLAIPHKDTNDADLPMSSRLYLALRGYFDGENLDVLTIREWPEMPNLFGQWPYFAVARLVDEGRALAIEGDADGGLCAWLAESLGLGRSYLTDWLEHDDRTITVWHGGAAPMSLCEPPGTPGAPRIARHFNIKHPAVAEATIRAGMPVTVYRMWRCDGRYFFTAREGESIKPRRHLRATNGLLRMKDNPGVWFDEMVHEGMPHHVSVVAGHHQALFRRLARTLGITFL